MELRIETTTDGSPTLYRADIDEHYHSVKGALAESRHVYVETGWGSAAVSSRRAVRVFEVGFGTGLNAALTAQAAARSEIPTIYYSVELYPLPVVTVEAFGLGLPDELRYEFMAVNTATWEEEVVINPFFTLKKLNANLLTMDSIPSDLDAVYFDAFAPEKQSDMWQEPVFRKIFTAMAPGGVLTTYCAKGAIRRMLQAVGFTTERLPGPPQGKREILRASRPPVA